MGAGLDGYAVLGVAPDASDAELRRVYRELVKRHHPDHNGGSPESAARFEQIQEAYAAILRRRRVPAGDVNARLAAIEAELRQEAAARAAAARARAAQAQARAQTRQPTPEELGHYTTEDSFTKIIEDAAGQLARRLSDLFGGSR